MAQGSWKIARGKGSAQLPLAIVAVLAVVVVLVGKAQSSLFTRVRTEFSDWSRPALIWVSGPVDVVSKHVGNAGSIFSAYEENIRLKEEVARLRQWQGAALLLEQRVKRYQLLINAVPDPSMRSLVAHVIGRARRPFLDTMILDAGKSAGIRPGEAVVDPSGMIGRVFVTGERTSWVILLTDLNSRIPVRTVSGNVQAILTGDNTPAPLLENATDVSKLQPGDSVVTSGDGGLLPPDLPVGMVVKDGAVMRVALLADPSTSEDVGIVDFKKPPEDPPATTLGDLPASALPPPVKQTPAADPTGAPQPAQPAPAHPLAQPPRRAGR